MKVKGISDKCDIECGILGSKGSTQNDGMLQLEKWQNESKSQVMTFNRVDAGRKHKKRCVLFLDLGLLHKVMFSL